MQLVDVRDESSAARPSVSEAFELVHEGPDFRVVSSSWLYAGRVDLDRDGVPDRIDQATQATLATLEAFAALDLGPAPDDGDGELDVFVLPLGGGIGGYVYLESQIPASRGASGYVVVDGSAGRDAAEFSRIVSSAVARLLLAGVDADAPTWWAEPTALWIAETAVRSRPPSLRTALTDPQRLAAGPMVSDVSLAAENLVLLDALQDDRIAQSVISATWVELGSQRADEPRKAVERGLAASIGLDLSELFARAVTWNVLRLDGLPTGSPAVSSLPVFDLRSPFPVEPGGISVLEVLPGAGELTELIVETDDPHWSVALVSRRSPDRWELSRLDGADSSAADSILLPWSDYGRAVAIFSRSSAADGAGRVSFDARPGENGRLFALSASGGAFASRSASVEISWSSAWETELFGWLVERADAPEGPWVAIRPFPTPALGTADEGAAYSLDDAWPADSSRVWYRVVALTRQGLRVATAPFAVAPRASP